MAKCYVVTKIMDVYTNECGGNDLTYETLKVFTSMERAELYADKFIRDEIDEIIKEQRDEESDIIGLNVTYNDATTLGYKWRKLVAPTKIVYSYLNYETTDNELLYYTLEIAECELE